MVPDCVERLVQGDWGTQFGMLIQYIAESRPGGINDTNIEHEDLGQLQALYKVGEWLLPAF